MQNHDHSATREVTYEAERLTDGRIIYVHLTRRSGTLSVVALPFSLQKAF